MKYRNFYICKVNGCGWRVKGNPKDNFALHNYSFSMAKYAKEHIREDYQNLVKNKYKRLTSEHLYSDEKERLFTTRFHQAHEDFCNLCLIKENEKRKK